MCEELATLQNRVPPEPREGIAAVLEAELGDVDDVFAEFDWEPLAAASIGQTHRGRRCAPARRSSSRSSVPASRRRWSATSAALALLADLAQRRTPFGRGLRSGDMLAQFAEGLREPSSTSGARPTR